MSEVSEVLATFATGTYTVTRRGASSYASGTGEPVAGSTSTFTAVASVQPMPGREAKNLPEGIATEDARVMYVEELLRAADDRTKTQGDRVAVDGDSFEAIKVEPWGGALLPHYRVTLVRRGYGT